MCRTPVVVSVQKGEVVWQGGAHEGRRIITHFLPRTHTIHAYTHIHRWLVFGGAISALGLMTILSVCLGFATMIIPRSITFYISTALLALFGFKMLYEGYNMDPNEGQEELEEVTEELRKREESVS